MLLQERKQTRKTKWSENIPHLSCFQICFSPFSEINENFLSISLLILWINIVPIRQAFCSRCLSESHKRLWAWSLLFSLPTKQSRVPLKFISSAARDVPALSAPFKILLVALSKHLHRTREFNYSIQTPSQPCYLDFKENTQRDKVWIAKTLFSFIIEAEWGFFFFIASRKTNHGNKRKWESFMAADFHENHRFFSGTSLRDDSSLDAY